MNNQHVTFAYMKMTVPSGTQNSLSTETLFRDIIMTEDFVALEKSVVTNISKKFVAKPFPDLKMIVSFLKGIIVVLNMKQ